MTRNKFLQLEKELNEEILERHQEIHTAVLALLSNKHHFQVGPPGTAKSLLVDRIRKRIEELRGGEHYFKWLLTDYTIPEELFGGPDFKLLREQGLYKRVTAGKLPEAVVAFADEIFKANSSILNTMLTIMNEREFCNADETSAVPLISMFAASNEVPDSENLWALWDRLHFRHHVEPLKNKSSFNALLVSNPTDMPDVVLSLDDIRQAQQECAKVVIPETVYDALTELRSNIRKDGVEPTDRRWVDCLDIIRCEAWLNGSDTVDIEHLRPLMHVLWSSDDEKRTIVKHVLNMANPIDREALDLIDRLNDLDVQITEIIEKSEDKKVLADAGVEIHRKLDKAEQTLKKLQKEDGATSRTSVFLADLEQKFDVVTQRLGFEVFQIDLNDD